MPIVNYIREHEWFIEYAADEGLTPNDVALYDAILYFVNRKAEGNDWPEDFIRIRNDRLLPFCHMGFDAMARSRNKLKQKGVIDFLNGNRNSEAPAYKILYKCLEDESSSHDNLFYPLKTDKPADKTTDKSAYKSTGKSADKPADKSAYIIPNYTGNGIRYQNDIDEDDEDGDDIRAGACEDPIIDRKEREAGIRAGFVRAFGRKPYPVELDGLVQSSWLIKMSVPMVCRAMEIASKEGAKVPVKYVLTVLGDWKLHEVMQPHQIDAFRVSEDMRNGRNGLYGTGDAAEDWKRAAEERKARRKENEDAGIYDSEPEAWEG